MPCFRAYESEKIWAWHTEMFTDGVMHMINSGNVTGEKKTLHPRKVVSSIIMGTKALYTSSIRMI